jgi:hypothetical protein
MAKYDLRWQQHMKLPKNVRLMNQICNVELDPNNLPNDLFEEELIEMQRSGHAANTGWMFSANRTIILYISFMYYGFNFQQMEIVSQHWEGITDFISNNHQAFVRLKQMSTELSGATSLSDDSLAFLERYLYLLYMVEAVSDIARNSG